MYHFLYCLMKYPLWLNWPNILVAIISQSVLSIFINFQDVHRGWQENPIIFKIEIFKMGKIIIGTIGNRWTYWDCPNICIIEIIKNTERSPRDLKKLAVTQSPVKDHHLKQIWKTHQERNNRKNIHNYNKKKNLPSGEVPVM